ncbi:unnamed protein product, partial [marine sediment metagenome]
MKKVILGIFILVLVIILIILGYNYWQAQKSVTGTRTEVALTGVEWFQAGNTQDINKLQTKKSEELEDNKMGGLWDLKTPDHYGESPKQFVHDINELGTKRIRVIIDEGDWHDVDWDKEEYSHFYIQDHTEKVINGLADKGLKILCGLVFWDPEGPSFKEEEEQDYSRFK